MTLYESLKSVFQTILIQFFLHFFSGYDFMILSLISGVVLGMAFIDNYNIFFSSLGEHLTDAELVEYLMTLMGCSDNPEVEGSYTEDPATALNELPLQLSAPSFAEDLLGLST